MAQEGLLGGQKKFRFTPQTFCAILLALILSGAFYRVMHRIHDEGVAHPALVMFLPFATILWLASMIPIFMFLAYQDDFRNLNPLVPSQYAIIAKRCFIAMRDNNFKVSVKDF